MDRQPQPIYIDVLTDFGFKKVLLNPANKEVLLRFINRMLECIGESAVVDLEYLPTEHVGLDTHLKSVVQNLECRTSDGRHFIVEMQRAIESDFRDRVCFYAFRKSIDSVEAGKRYQLNKVYVIIIAEEEVRRDSPDILQMATLRFEDSPERFVRYPIFLILELSKVPRSTEHACLRYWHQAFRHLGEWSSPPADNELEREVSPLLSAAKIAILDAMEQYEYYRQMDKKRGLKYAFEHKWNTGLAEGYERGKAEGEIKGEVRGRVEGKGEVVRRMLARGFSWDLITDVTGMREEEWLKS